MFVHKSHKIGVAVEYETVQSKVMNPANCNLQVMLQHFECCQRKRLSKLKHFTIID